MLGRYPRARRAARLACPVDRDALEYAHLLRGSPPEATPLHADEQKDEMNRGLVFFGTCSLWLLAACAGSPPKSDTNTPKTPEGGAPTTTAAPSPGTVEPAKNGHKPVTKTDSSSGREKPAPRPGTGSTAAPSQEAKPAPGSGGGEKPTEVAPAGAGQDDGRSARDHVLEAMRLLDKGDPETAWIELTAALKQEPDNETATSLLRQMDTDPEEMLGKEHFSYTTQSGDTLSRLAKKFLNDERKFYVLARYNGIRVPGDLAAGQVVKIPGKRPASLPKPAPAPPPAPPPAKEAPAPAPKAVPPPKEAPPPSPPPAPAKGSVREGEASPDKLYQAGVQALSTGAPDRAYELFSQALKANPKHTAAQDKMRDIKPAAVEAYYKKAMSALRRHDLDETIRYCNRALELDPDNEKVKLRRAEALELQEKMKNLK